MKQIYMQSKTPRNIKDVYSGNDQLNFNPKTNRMKSSIASTGDEGKRKAIERTDNLNIFPNQNLGKGPPGRSRSPGVGHGLFPDHPPDGEADRDASPLSFGREGPGVSQKRIHFIHTEQTFYNTQILNFNFLQTLNFTIMKKQILIFVFLALAVFAGVNKSYGQLPRSTKVVTPLSCSATATFLNPVAGVPYVYSMDGTTGADQVSQWQWFATKDPNFMTASGTFTANKLTVSPSQLLNASANYNNGLGASASVTITWTPELLSNTLYQGSPSTTVFPSPTFVVGYGKGTNCADNIKVYEINPTKNFVVNIAPIDPGTLTSTATWGGTVTSCVASVVSATYNAGNLVMDYGVNTLYFEIGAANFVKNFEPTLQLMSGLSGVQTAVVTLFPTMADAVAGTNATGTVTWSTGAAAWDVGHTFAAASAADVANGVSVFVKVVITNSSFESLVANPFVLAVDARDNDNTGIWDMEDADCTTVTNVPDQVDQATHVVNPRPTIIGANVPDANVTPPNNLIPKLP